MTDGDRLRERIKRLQDRVFAAEEKLERQAIQLESYEAEVAAKKNQQPSPLPPPPYQRPPQL